MRICLFTPTFLPRLGGAERSADAIARGLHERGHEVRVLARGAGKGKAEVDVPYPVHRYARSRHLHRFPRAFAWPLWRLYRQWPFDVCLAFYSYPTGYAASLLKRRLGFKVICSPRGQDMYEDSRMLDDARLRRLIERGYRDADRIITNSHAMAERLQTVVGGVGPIDVIHNGIDLQACDRMRGALAEGSPQLPIAEPFMLHLARLARVKNQALAVRAVAKLGDRFRELGVQYAIVGEGNPDRGQLERLIAEHDVGDIVKLLGARTGIEKAWLFAHARCFVSTSREEGFPNVMLEAMAHGLPALASNIGPHRETLGEQHWGRLFESDNLEDLTDKLNEMLSVDLEPMCRRAWELRERFDLSRMIDGYEQACRAVVQ